MFSTYCIINDTIKRGLGTAIILKAHSSTGGSDLVSMIVKEYNANIRTSNVIIIIDIIICLALIVLSMIQSKEDEGLTSTITGSSSSNFFEQNKGRTKEGKQKRWTIILGIAFAIVSIALAIVYPI